MSRQLSPNSSAFRGLTSGMVTPALGVADPLLIDEAGEPAYNRYFAANQPAIQARVAATVLNHLETGH